MTPCWFWHDWAFLELIRRVVQKRGPFDPTSEAKRTVTFLQYVCCKCGRIKEEESGND